MKNRFANEALGDISNLGENGWDNRATMHRARPFDDTKYCRELRRVTALDVPEPAHTPSMRA